MKFGGVVCKGLWNKDYVEYAQSIGDLYDFDKDGITDGHIEKMTFTDKLNLVWVGFKMIGVKALLFVVYNFWGKVKRLFS